MKNKNKLYTDENDDIIVPSYTPFVEQKKNIDRSTLYRFKSPFELLHADIAYINFLAKSAVHPKHYLLFVDLFTSKIYTYLMKNRSLLRKKIELFIMI